MALALYELIGADPARPFSPHCWKARMALRHKELEPELRRVRFTEVPQVEGGISKTVPVLRDGETIVADSFTIAEYLEETYPERPTLFGGEGGRRLSRFVEAYAMALHPVITGFLVQDVMGILEATDQTYFRQSREQRLGKTIEAAQAGREDRLAGFHASLAPVASVLDRQPFLGGEQPLFADHILFASFQWLRIVTPFKAMPAAGPIPDWFERCLDLYGQEGRKVAAAA